METDCSKLVRPHAAGAILALLAILFGFGMGLAFGAAEDSIKGGLNASGDAVLESVYQGDTAKKDAVVKKSWSYMKRAHMHGGAIGTTALSAIVLLALLGAGDPLGRLSSLCFGLGALLYGLFWMLAAFKAPGLGSTHAAKEALGFIAIPGAALSFLGALGTLAVVIRSLFREPGCCE